jgi:hypothetical protein
MHVTKSIKNINIYSDSRAAIQAIKNPVYKSKIVKECKMNLKHLERSIKIKILWIKGHKNHTGNELADMLAKKGTNPTCGLYPMLALPRNVIRQKISEHFRKKWQKEWENPLEDENFRQTKIFIKTVDNSKIYRKRILRRSRKHLYKLASYITGHCTLMRHLKIMKIKDDKTCRLCGDNDETPSHLVL